MGRVQQMLEAFTLYAHAASDGFGGGSCSTGVDALCLHCWRFLAVGLENRRGLVCHFLGRLCLSCQV